MAADRTVPCDHSIRRESSWKAESVIGWSAAQRDLNCNPMAKFFFNYAGRKVEIRKGGKGALPPRHTHTQR